MGAPQRLGSEKQYLTTIAGDPAKSDVFDGVDTTWNRVPGGEPVGAALKEADEAWTVGHPEKSVPALLKAKTVMDKLSGPIAERKKKELTEAIALCADVWLDAEADRYEVTPGSELKITAKAINRGPLKIGAEAALETPAGPTVNDGILASNELKSMPMSTRLPANAPYSQPYWLRAPKQGDTYTVGNQLDIGLPENPPLLNVAFTLNFGHEDVRVERPVIYRYIDHTRGELTRPVVVVPAVSVAFSARSLIFPSGQPKDVMVELRATGEKNSGDARLSTPDGWRAEPDVEKFQLPASGLEADTSFRLMPPEGDSVAKLSAIADAGGQKYDTGIDEINYPHITPQFLFPPAEAKIVKADIRTLAKSIGYVMGAGDQMPGALRQIGCDVTLLGSSDLARGDLSRFDAIVIGIRAYNTRADLRANENRLLDYVHNGGTLVVQYNTAIEADLAHVGPYPVTFNRDRVTVEEAPVKFIKPSSPLLNEPNRITESDFDGWVQERGLYFATKWDSRYQPLFETHDPGEKPLLGSTLYARYGRGAYIFTALAWFRELPAGVPGAFRIFANFLSASKTLASEPTASGRP